MNQQGVLIFIILLLAVALSGFLMGGWIAPPPEANPLVASAPAPTLAPADSIYITFLVVDSLTSPAPQLQMCWVMAFSPGANQYYLSGFPVTTPISVSTYVETLQALFEADAQPQTGNQHYFLHQGLQAFAPGFPTPAADIILDQPALTQAIDRIPGLLVGSEMYQGADIWPAYAMLAANPSAQLDWQINLMVNFFRALQTRHITLADFVRETNASAQWYPDYDTVLRLVETAPPLTDPETQFIPFMYEATPAP